MELVIKKIPLMFSNAGSVPNILDKFGVDWNDIGCQNWSDDYPYKPKVIFRIAHTGNQIFLQYDIEEQYIRALVVQDNDCVWEDSCCEFFIAPENDGWYYNLECNCIGTLLLGVGKGKDNRELAPKEHLEKVMRWTSLKRHSIPLKKGVFHWQIALIIPFQAFFKHNLNSMSGRTVLCNFYKCGDKLSKPHFLSWRPVKSPIPDFHKTNSFVPCFIC